MMYKLRPKYDTYFSSAMKFFSFCGDKHTNMNTRNVILSKIISQ